MKIKIDAVSERDFEPLIELFKEFAAFEKLSDKMINTVERMQAEKDLFKGFVVRNDNDEIIGYTIFFFAYFTWSGKTLYMDDLYIKEPYRQNGIGTKLIRKVMEYGRAENCLKMRWQVSNWNHPAINFYESLGGVINKTEMNCDLELQSVDL